MLSHEEFTSPLETEALVVGYGVTDSADIGSKGLARIKKCNLSGIDSSNRTLPSSEIQKQWMHSGLPDFSQVYSFIGSVFDPDTKGHAQKLREMDPINFETVLLLMRNLSINLSSLGFEPIREVLVSYDVITKTVAAGIVTTKLSTDMSC